MYKKLFSMLLAASLALSLTACGGGSESTVDESDDIRLPRRLPRRKPRRIRVPQTPIPTVAPVFLFLLFLEQRSSDIDPDDYSFEDYLKDNDPDSYESIRIWKKAGIPANGIRKTDLFPMTATTPTMTLRTTCTKTIVIPMIAIKLGGRLELRYLGLGKRIFPIKGED